MLNHESGITLANTYTLSKDPNQAILSLSISEMSTVDDIITGFGVAAALTASCLILLSSDFVSRRILSPEQLYSKRRQDQLYDLDNAIKHSIQNIRQHVNEGYQFDSESEKSITDVILSVDDVSNLVKGILDSESKLAPMVVAISKDLSLPMDQLYIFLAFPQQDAVQKDGSRRYNRRVQVPLLKFCTALASIFKNQNESSAICFIADASSSLSSEILGKVICNCQAKLPLVQEPAWMIWLSMLIRRSMMDSTEAETVIYALIKLEVYSRLHLSGTFNTIVFSLPGQSCTPIMMPILQKLFPSERHVFAYDGCVRSVERGLALHKGLISDTPDLAVESMPRHLSACVPCMPLQQKLSGLPACLRKLNRATAGLVEAWMASVDAFITLKENEENNQYSPFVCKMEYFLSDDEKMPELALTNILEFITGSRPKFLDEDVVRAAKSIMVDFRKDMKQDMVKILRINPDSHKLIENCVFTHKMILIGDKTLIDTVEPREKWRLKTTKCINTCACCFGEDENSDDEAWVSIKRDQFLFDPNKSQKSKVE